jgi:AcrR family transcriptional regulator
MSFTEVLERSGAARGAIYHHFPGGKNQLVAEATVRNGQEARISLSQLPTESPRGLVEAGLREVAAGAGRQATSNPSIRRPRQSCHSLATALRPDSGD